MTEFRRIAVRKDVQLNVALAGDQRSPAVMMLHGFPESHRTWRALAPRLQERFYLIMPDQVGFAAS
ncbi:MAG TPA: alpha/beta fold hydrolase, partial [Sphingomicrobium sp.]